MAVLHCRNGYGRRPVTQMIKIKSLKDLRLVSTHHLPEAHLPSSNILQFFLCCRTPVPDFPIGWRVLRWGLQNKVSHLAILATCFRHVPMPLCAVTFLHLTLERIRLIPSSDDSIDLSAIPDSLLESLATRLGLQPLLLPTPKHRLEDYWCWDFCSTVDLKFPVRPDRLILLGIYEVQCLRFFGLANSISHLFCPSSALQDILTFHRS